MIEVNCSVLHKCIDSYQTPFFFSLDKYNSSYQAYEAAHLGSTDAARRVPPWRPMRGVATDAAARTSVSRLIFFFFGDSQRFGPNRILLAKYRCVLPGKRKSTLVKKKKKRKLKLKIQVEIAVVAVTISPALTPFFFFFIASSSSSSSFFFFFLPEPQPISFLNKFC